MGLLTCFSVPSLKTRSGSLSPTHSLLFSAAFFSLPTTYMVLTLPHSLAFTSNLSLASSLLFDPVHYLPSNSHCPLWVSTSLFCCLVLRVTLLWKRHKNFCYSGMSPKPPLVHNLIITRHLNPWLPTEIVLYVCIDVCMHDIASFNEPLSLSRDCLGCRPGFCSTMLSECFSTRQTRTASSNREPSGVSAHRPVKCKPSSGWWTSASGIKDGHAVIH